MSLTKRRTALFPVATALLLLGSAACSSDSPDTEPAAESDTATAEAPEGPDSNAGASAEEADSSSVYGGDLDVLGTALQSATGASGFTVDDSTLHLRFSEGSVEDPSASVNCLVAHEMQDEGHGVVLEYPDGTKDCATDEAVAFAEDLGESSVGTASLSIGDLSWEFTHVVCAFGEDEIGIEGAEFNMIAGNGSASVYAAIDPGHTYIEFADPTAADATQREFITLIEPTIEIDGKNIYAPASFATYEDPDTLLMGALTATCP